MTAIDQHSAPIRRPAVLCLVLSAMLSATGAAEAAECSLSHRSRGAILKAIQTASSCESAREIMHACASNTAGDVAFSDAVVARCERLFKPQLSPVDRTEYERRMRSCETKNARERGTESVSLSARCKAGVAADFAK